MKDLKGRYLMINSAGARFLGRSTEEVIGKNDTELFTPEDGREIMKRDREVVQSGETQTYEERHLRRSGPHLRELFGPEVGREIGA